MRPFQKFVHFEGNVRPVVLNMSCRLGWIESQNGRPDPYVPCGRIPVKIVQAVSPPGIVDDYQEIYTEPLQRLE